MHPEKTLLHPCPSGNEGAMTEFLLAYNPRARHRWKHQPAVFPAKTFRIACPYWYLESHEQPSLPILIRIGFTVRYNRQLVRIGSSYILKAEIDWSDTMTGGAIPVRLGLTMKKSLAPCSNTRTGPRYRPDVQTEMDRRRITWPMLLRMDNRLGVWNALRLCETLGAWSRGIFVLGRTRWRKCCISPVFLWERYGIRQALISDVTWVTEGVPAGKGP